MDEAQELLRLLLASVDGAGWPVGAILLLGFVLGLMTGLIIFYQAHVRA